MKILFPCPACKHPLSPPRYASRTAQLRCSFCGHALIANSILIDDDQPEGVWEVVEDAGTENAFASFYQPVEADVLQGLSIDEIEPQGGTVVVPQSNEWETQSSTVQIEEALDTDSEHRIANDGLTAHTVEQDANSVVETDQLEDEMIGVSDEPWFSPIAVDHAETQEKNLEFEADHKPLATETVRHFVPFEPLAEDELTAEEEVEEKLFDDEATIEFQVDDEPLELLEDEASLSSAFDSLQQTKKAATSDLLGTANLRPRARKKSSPIGTLVSVFGGGLAAFPISILLMWYALGKDPLDAGPAVAKLVPWIVPERFHGGLSGRMGKFPSIPTTSSSSEVDQSEPGRLPQIGGKKRVPQRSDAELTFPNSTSETAADSGATISSGTTIASGRAVTSDATGSLGRTTTSEPSIVPEGGFEINSLKELPTDPATLQLASKASKIDGLFGMEKETPFIPDEQTSDALEKAALLLENAVSGFTEERNSGTEVFRSLTELGKLLANLPDGSPQESQWRDRTVKIGSAIVSNTKLLGPLKAFIEEEQTANKTDENAKRSARVDFVKISSVESKGDHDIWKTEKRFRSNLEVFPLIVSHRLGIKASSSTFFLIIESREIQPDAEKSVDTVLLAVPMLP